MTYELKHPETGEAYRLLIEQDTDAQNPRTECDRMSKMVCFHNRYKLPNEGEYNRDNFSGWQGLKAQLITDGAKVILPVYMYDHSCLSVSTEPFSCRWDSGQIGFIFLTNKAIKENFPSWKTVSTRRWLELEECLIGEVETYNNYLNGDVWGFKFQKIKTGIIAGTEDNEEPDCDEVITEEDSCWGFYGSDMRTNGIFDHLEDWVKTQVWEQAGYEDFSPNLIKNRL